MPQADIEKFIRTVLAERAKAQAVVDRYNRQLQAAQRLIGDISDGARPSRAPKGAKAPARKGRRLVEDDAILAHLRSMGVTTMTDKQPEGLTSAQLADQFGLTGAQMTAVMQRMQAAGKVKSNGVRGRGGRWFLPGSGSGSGSGS